MKHSKRDLLPTRHDDWLRITAPRLMRAFLPAILFIAPALARAAEAQRQEVPLHVPKQIVSDFIAGKTNYIVSFAVTNTSSVPIPIVGYTASCQCTSVEAVGNVVPPNGEIQIRATVSQREPTVQYVILQDSATNFYQTMIWIKPSAK